MRWILPAIPFLLAACCRSEPPRIPPPEPRFQIEVESLLTVFEGDPGSAFAAKIRITREDPDAGRAEWSGVHVTEDRVGGRRNGGQWSFTHEVWSPRLGRPVLLDFDTGFKVRSIRGGILEKVDTEACGLESNLLAVRACDGLRPVRSEIWCDEVILVDRSGRVTPIRFFRQGFKRASLLCAVHGAMRSPLRVLNEANFAAFLAARAEAAQGAREDQAVSLLKEAEFGWRSRVTRVQASSQSDYLLLLNDFSDVGCVIRNRERIKARAEAVLEE